MKYLYLICLLGLMVGMNCVDHEVTVTLENTSAANIAELSMDNLYLRTVGIDTDTEVIEPGTYATEVYVYVGAIGGHAPYTCLHEDTITVEGDVICTANEDGTITWH